MEPQRRHLCEARWTGLRRATGGLAGVSVVLLAWHAVHGALPQQGESRAPQHLVTVRMAGVPLRAALERLGSAHGQGLFLDRRVDPSQPVDVDLPPLPLTEAIARIADERHLSTSRVGPVIYVGPEVATSRLRTLAALRRADVEALGEPARVRLSTPFQLQWPDLATPRSILQRIAAKSDVAVSNLDLVPHDLWPAGRLPALPAVDLMTLVGNGLDLTFSASDDGNSVRLVPIRDPVVIERQYRVSRRSRSEYRALSHRIPNADVHMGRRQVRVIGRVEDHERVAKWLRGESLIEPEPVAQPAPALSDDAVRRHTLRAHDQPLPRIVQHLVDQLAVDIRIDEEAFREAGRSPDVSVAIDVRDVSLEELLRQLVASAGLRVQHTGQTYWIVPAR